MNSQNRFRRAFLLISIVILALSLTIPSKAGQIKDQPRKRLQPSRSQAVVWIAAGLELA